HTVRLRCARISGRAAASGLGQGRTAPRINGAASARCRAPPNTTSAASTRRRPAGARPAAPSSPMPTMDSQRRGAAGWRPSGSVGETADGAGEEAGRGSGAMRVLVLGGTSEGRQLAAWLAARADVAVMLSLAGRTRAPAPQGAPVRIGGFGGEEGL